MTNKTRHIFKKILCLVLMFGLLSTMSIGLLLVNAEDTVSAEDARATVYIKSDYTTGAYFYEDNGVLRYGTPLEGDKSFIWEVELVSGNYSIMNTATGHYITLEDYQGTGSAELVTVGEIVEGSDKHLWKFEIDEKQNIISASSEFNNTGLHIQDITDGHVACDALAGNELSWGNMLWNFFTADEINFSATGRDGFCIQSNDTKSYLKAEGSKVIYGKPSGPDDSYIWNITLNSDGTKTIVNKSTGKTLSLSGNSIALSDSAYKWNTQIAIGTKLVGEDNKTGIVSGNDTAPAVADVSESTSKDVTWTIVTAADVGNVAGDLKMNSDEVYTLCNSWFSMYLIEADGVPVYGNADPADKNAQWKIVYDDASGLSALINAETGHYVHSGAGPEGLVCDSEEVYYWKILRNKSDLYPDAIVFQDSKDATKYLHMENLTGSAENSGAVQPTWGTPHWVPTAVTADTQPSSSGGTVDIPSGYVRFQSTAEEGQYLYMTKAGGMAYGKVGEGDARSHFEFVKGETEGVYHLVNREYGLYVQNLGSGVLRSFEADAITGEGANWKLLSAGEENAVLICNAYSSVPEFQLPSINIQELSGLAKSTLVSNRDETAIWIMETAPDKVSSQSDENDVSVPLSVIDNMSTYSISVNGEEKDGNYKIEYYGNAARIFNAETGKYLYNKNDNLKEKKLSRLNDSSVNWSEANTLGATHLTSGEIDITLRKVAADSVYMAEDAYITENSATFAVYAQTGGNYKIDIDGNKSGTLSVNGIIIEDVTLPLSTELTLNKGINTIKIKGDFEISKLTVHDSYGIDTYGATTGYARYEAEDCDTNAEVMEENYNFTEISAEMSGRSGVKLNGTSKNLKFTLAEDTNAFVLRYCIPDSKDGLGQSATLALYANGEKIKDLELTSKFSWLYKETENCTNEPSDGLPHNYFDEAAFILDETLPAGTEIKLQKDVSSYAEYYIIDLIETELIEGPLSQPADSLSVTDFGAVADDGKDDSEAFTACLNEAQETGKEVWIPEGTFDVPTTYKLVLGDVTIRGAGMWYTTVNDILFEASSKNLGFYDFAMRGSVTLRDNEGDRAAFQGTTNCNGFTAQNLWIQHYKCGFWMTFSDRVHIVGCRVRDVYADGVNLQSECEKSMIEQSDWRNTGDDAIAMWSEFGNSNGNIVQNNTAALPNLANCVALYGGTDITIRRNLLSDNVNVGAGVNISTNFKPQNRFIGTIEVSENKLIRCGGNESQNGNNLGAVWFNTPLGYDNGATVNVKDNYILSSVCQGVSFEGNGKVANAVIESNYIELSGTMGVQVMNGAEGFSTLKNNIIADAMLDQYYNAAPDTFILLISNSEIGGVWNNGGIIATVIVCGILCFAGTLALAYIYICDRKGIVPVFLKKN
ncbi:MAG: glycosyl hydrolase family 28-related protein [Ruminococcus sp.]